jgi:3,4-dihydroxy 2-butanone 4-phosphate synthase/GTP cyclohydrolase II
MIVRLAERPLITKFGTFKEILYYDGLKESLAIVMGDVENSENVLCRVHSACISAHVFNSIECDCREQMESSQQLISQDGKGIIIWLDQEGRGNGHFALINSAKLATNEKITQTEAYKRLGFSEDARSFVRAVDILNDLKIKSVVLLTNNPEKAKDLIRDGINVTNTRRVAVDVKDNVNLKTYYADKIARGHNLEIEE